jgi:hypothetical protein
MSFRSVVWEKNQADLHDSHIFSLFRKQKRMIFKKHLL